MHKTFLEINLNLRSHYNALMLSAANIENETKIYENKHEEEEKVELGR